jgi:hypothetical protein
MATTSIIVELLIIGFFTVVWIAIWSVRFSLIDIELLRHLSSSIQSTPGLLFITALSYQLGVVMNGISHKIMMRLGRSEYRDQIDPGVPYDVVNIKVRQCASEDLVRILALHLSVMRLTRAGIINFALISLGMFSFGGRTALAGFVPLFVALMSAIGWRRAYRRYYGRMAHAYQEITGRPINNSLYSE